MVKVPLSNSLLERRDARRKFSESLGAGASLAPCLCQRIPLGSIIDHLHNYGPGTRFGASQARFGCVVCVSHWSFRFSAALECRSAITVVFLAFSIEAGLVLHSFLMVFNGQVSSGSAGYLPFVRLTGRTSASPTTRSYALSMSSLQQIFAFMLVPKSLWTLPSPVI